MNTHRRRTHIKRVVCIAAALLASGSLVAAPAAIAAGPEKAPTARTIKFDTRFDDMGGLTTPHNCSPGTPGVCTLTFSSTPVWTGAFKGISINRAYGSYNPLTQELHGVVWEYFPQVTVAGCGTGTMMWRGEIVMTSEQQDPTKGGLVIDGKWDYVPGSGTGDLANMVSGTFTMNDGVFKLPFFENHEDVKGSLVCRTSGS